MAAVDYNNRIDLRFDAPQDLAVPMDYRQDFNTSQSYNGRQDFNSHQDFNAAFEDSVRGVSAAYDRTPPQYLVAEMSVLGGMLLSKDAIADVISTVSGNDFYKPAHEIIYNAILELFGRGHPADLLTVADALQKRGELARVGSSSYLADLLAGVPTAANAGYYARIVHERAQLRRLIDAGTRIVQLGYAEGGGEASELINMAQAEMYAVTDKRAGEDYRAVGEVLDETLKQLEDHHGGQMTGIPTGFRDLDTLTNGLQAGQMVVIAARPGLGKSTLALDFARSASIRNGKSAVFFSLEMNRNEILQRLLSAESQVFLEKMRNGNLQSVDWDHITNVTGRISDAPLFIDDSPNLTMMEIRAKARRIKQQHGLDLVIIDYLQLMTSGKSRVESRQQEVSEFSRALKLLAKELDIPVIALSQLNRGPEQRGDKKPALSDLRESGSIEQDADVVILLHRDYNDEDRAGEADLIVAKHRNGRTDTIPVLFRGHIARFDDITM
ncbi:MAG: replicative DNA helicase [Cellulomonadaceae bacterium]|nr:replicative DNA helicase [Cellulomonadaceae bacterium]